MPLATNNPTANTNPDPGQVGTIAVTSATNTGHGSTTSSAGAGSTQSKSCLWTTFLAPGGQILSITLKADWSINGSLSGLGPVDNLFEIDYSLNGGSSWTALKFASSVVSPSSGTSSAALSVTQNISQVRVRDTIEATTTDIGDTASITASVSLIRLEIQLADGAVGGMM